MNLAMYKSDEGYWTRVMSAIGWGLVAAWLAVWLWDRSETFVPRDEAGAPTIEPQLLQGGVAAAMLLIGGGLVYWMVYLRRASSEFLIATDSEMKKVNWSTRREVLGSTWVVIGISLLLALSLLVVDVIFANFFQFIKVLKTG